MGPSAHPVAVTVTRPTSATCEPHFHVSTHDDRGVLHCSGDLDALAAPFLTAAVDATQPRERAIVFDLRQVHFVDVVGLRALVGGIDGRRDVLLLSPPGPVAKMIEVLGLDGPRLRICQASDPVTG